jgi:peptidoglycan/LPS O-acetylase OafA/YrhL
LFGEGHFAVVVFIVLSGFSLMLPISRSGTGRLTTSLAEFARRRVRRILPAYYAALVLGVSLVLAHQALGSMLHLQRTVTGVLEPGTIISHLLLVHNLKLAWVYKINAPLWSIATEWQIYFVFVLLLLPLFRRAGGLVGIALAWLLGSLPQMLLPDTASFWWACPWFLGSFALGMHASNIAFAPGFAESFWRKRAPWGWLTLASIAALAAVWRFDYQLKFIVRDALVSLSTLCLILHCVQRVSQSAQPSLLLRAFEARWVVWLGGFSYSLYAIQHPILTLVKLVFNRLPLGRDANYLLQLALVTPAVLAVSWLFAEFFERPTTGGGVVLPALRRRFERAPSTSS